MIYCTVLSNVLFIMLSLKVLEDCEHILIFGFAREGQSSVRFIQKHFPHIKISILDRHSYDEFSAISSLSLDNIVFYDEETVMNILDTVDVVVKSAGISYKHPFVHLIEKNNISLTTQTEIFFSLCKGKTVGITGAKGKSTTTSLLGHICQYSNQYKNKTHILGNIGTPLLDYFIKYDDCGENELFVLELSSYQLDRLEYSPHIALFLNAFPCHLDSHGNFEKYIEAKVNITKYQKEDDIFIYNGSFDLLSQAAQKTLAKALDYTHSKYTYDNDYVYNNENVYIERKDIPLYGDHNISNTCAALLITDILNISKDDIINSLKTFTSLPHRLECIMCDEKYFINDSIATLPEATIEAFSAFKNKIDCLIVGGDDTGMDIKFLAHHIIKNKISSLILLPITGKILKKYIEEEASQKNIPCPVFYDFTENFTKENMLDVVNQAKKITQKGRYCLFSPGGQSFGYFSSFEERGDLFKEVVLNDKK
jgi:UDP-N-acetylmuramoyl-L-alanine---L-glutamate ligase